MAAPAARVSACGRVHLEHPVVPLDDLQARLDEVALRATSVSRLISIPGATSIQREASPARGRKPWATVPRKAAYCGWRLSRNANDLSSIPFATTSVLPSDDLDPGRRPDSGGPGGDHVFCILRWCGHLPTP